MRSNPIRLLSRIRLLLTNTGNVCTTLSRASEVILYDFSSSTSRLLFIDLNFDALIFLLLLFDSFLVIFAVRPKIVHFPLKSLNLLLHSGQILLKTKRHFQFGISVKCSSVGPPSTSNYSSPSVDGPENFRP
ncbi:hypothetical protein L195_g059661, partial [Trifolium pratense]